MNKIGDETMQGFDWGSVLAMVATLFGGGVIGAIVKSLTEKRKLNAEATNTNIKSLLEIDQRMNERMAKLEERVAHLEQENYKLKSDKLNLEKETLKLKAKIQELEVENKALREENEELKLELEKFEKEVREYEQHE